MTSLQREIANLNDFQGQLQSDYDELQIMLEEKQREVENLTKELEEMRPQAEGISADIQVSSTSNLIFWKFFFGKQVNFQACFIKSFKSSVLSTGICGSVELVVRVWWVGYEFKVNVHIDTYLPVDVQQPCIVILIE